MAIHHECQHQELLVYDLQHLLGEQYKPAIKKSISNFIEIKKRKAIKLKEDYTIWDIQEKTIVTI